MKNAEALFFNGFIISIMDVLKSSYNKTLLVDICWLLSHIHYLGMLSGILCLCWRRKKKNPALNGKDYYIYKTK